MAILSILNACVLCISSTVIFSTSGHRCRVSSVNFFPTDTNQVIQHPPPSLLFLFPSHILRPLICRPSSCGSVSVVLNPQISCSWGGQCPPWRKPSVEVFRHQLVFSSGSAVVRGDSDCSPHLKMSQRADMIGEYLPTLIVWWPFEGLYNTHTHTHTPHSGV